MYGVKDNSVTMIGFELILMFYPFIKDAKNSQKYAHGGALTTTLMTLFIYLVSLVFYSQKQLALTIWPTLTMTSVIELPFIQRFEYIETSWWTIVIIPNMTISLWAASRGFKRLFNVQQKYPLWGMCILILLINIFVFDMDSIYILDKIINQFGVYFICLYLPLLLLIIYTKKLRKRK
ncbi:GerAB/ArcD/ProY family transporter [Peribacillus butanolivorans]|uniref:GerAB/ArcD/ProY family transporter n=1 Tax=Peribacillus butanolivorans TaxID=421767 RepID=UPI0030EF6D9A